MKIRFPLQYVNNHKKYQEPATKNNVTNKVCANVRKKPLLAERSLGLNVRVVMGKCHDSKN